MNLNTITGKLVPYTKTLIKKVICKLSMTSRIKEFLSCLKIIRLVNNLYKIKQIQKQE